MLPIGDCVRAFLILGALGIGVFAIAVTMLVVPEIVRVVVPEVVKAIVGSWVWPRWLPAKRFATRGSSCDRLYLGILSNTAEQDHFFDIFCYLKFLVLHCDMRKQLMYPILRGTCRS